MTKEEALYRFWNSYGNAYPVTAVPEKITAPYITYEVSIGNMGEEVPTTVQLWYHTDSEAVPNAKAQQIYDDLQDGGLSIPHDKGVIWVKTGSPYSVAVNGQDDNTIKVRQLNITYEFL